MSWNSSCLDSPTGEVQSSPPPSGRVVPQMVRPHCQERRTHVHVESAEAFLEVGDASVQTDRQNRKGRGTLGFRKVGVPHAGNKGEGQFAHEKAVHPPKGKQAEVDLLLLQVVVQRCL